MLSTLFANGRDIFSTMESVVIINHTLPYCITHVTHSNFLLFYQTLLGGSKVTVATNYYIPLYNDV